MTEIEARFILGLRGTFSSEDLKRAYRKAAAENHPDRGGNPERMMLVNEAYELLRFPPPSPHVEPEPEDLPPTDVNAAPSPPQTNPTGHPLDKYVFRTSGVLAVAMWIYTLATGRFDDAGEFWWTVLAGVPIFYFIFFLLVRFVVGSGIRIYNFGVRVNDWIASKTGVPPGAESSSTQQGPLGWGFVLALVAFGVLAFFIGDRSGEDYSGGFVFVGWVFIGLAVAGRKSSAARAVYATFSQRWSAMGAFGKFVGGVAKVALGIVVAIAVVAGVAWAVVEQRNNARETENAPLAQRKDWPPITAQALGGAKFALATMWRDGQVFYQLQVEGYPGPIAAAINTSLSQASFTLIFEDAGGFKLREKRVPLNEMIRMAGDGEVTGLSWSDSEFADATKYRDSVSWNIVWVGFPASR